MPKFIDSIDWRIITTIDQTFSIGERPEEHEDSGNSRTAAICPLSKSDTCW